MRKTIKIAAAVFSAVLALSGTSAFAQSTDTKTTETVIEDNRTLTPVGNAELTDDVTDNENLQFITVTARDGNTFYFIIDKGANSENVYFLNTVDESDLAALVEESESLTNPTATAKPGVTNEPEETAETEPETKDTKQPEQKESNNGFMLILLVIIGAGALAVYYFKVLLPKKKLEQADDIEDFEFEEYDDDTDDTENEDDTEE